MFWFDLDNSPHVPLFRPIFYDLEQREIDYFVTARDFAQTKELLELFNIHHSLIGNHGGKSKLKKLINLFERSNQLYKNIKKWPIQLAVNHGSRTQLIAAKRLGIKAITLLDYEYTEHYIFNFLANYIIMPVYIPDEHLKKNGFNLKKVIRYNGFKEELYLKYFQPDINFRKKIGISEDIILVVFRPPSMTGNYHDNKSEELLISGINYFSQNIDVVCLIVNRTEYEKNFIKNRIKKKENIKFLEKPVDGLQLLYAADYAISGGGTMNREAALLGTRTYSIFTGKRPYLDSFLQEQGRLTFIEGREDFNKIEIKRDLNKKLPVFSNDLAREIVDIFLEVL